MSLSKKLRTGSSVADQLSRSLIKIGNVLMVVLDTRGKIIHLNSRAQEVTGFSQKEAKGEIFWDLLIPEDYVELVKEALGNLKENKLPKTYPLLTKDGHQKYISWDSAYLKDKEKDVKLIIVIGVNPTNPKRAGKVFQRSETNFKALFNSTLDGIVVIDAKTMEIVLVNKAALEIYGYDSLEEVVGENLLDFVSSDERKQTRKIIEEDMFKKDMREINEFRAFTKNGKEIWISAMGARTEYQGRLAGLISVRDITERKRAEQLLKGLNQAAVAMGKAQTPQEIFTAVAEELKKLGFSCSILLTSENGKVLLPKYLSYQPGVIKACEKLVGLDAEDFSIPIEAVDVYSKVIREQKTIFVKDAQEVVRQLLPKPAKRFAGQIAKMLKLSKSIDAPLIAEDEVIGLLTVQSKDLTEDDVPSITAFAHQMAATWRKAQLMQDLRQSLSKRKHAEKELKQSFEKLQRVLEDTVQAMAAIVETRDPYTAGHQRKVAQLASAIAKEMGLPDDQTEGIRRAGLIHDIGKINVPAEILSKPSELSDTEMELVKSHAQVGSELLDGAIEFPWPVAEIVLQHHERMDGSGYPRGLSGEEINLGARILAVADVVEAMSSHRPYRPAKSIDKALEEIRNNIRVSFMTLR